MHYCKKCGNKIPVKTSVNGKQRNLNGRSFCLACSPFGQHNTLDLSKEPKAEKICPKCNLLLPIDCFASNKQKKGNRRSKVSCYCKKCLSTYTREKQRQAKLQCIQYKGGKCEICGYNKCPGAMDFHHKDPSQKDFGICEKYRNVVNLPPEVFRELDKCLLLCRNCHCELHYNLAS